MHGADLNPQIDALIGPVQAPARRELRIVGANTLFGGFARRGTSGELGNDTDAALIKGLREWADVILVGSGTVTAEDYGPSDTPMAIVTENANLDPGLGVLGGKKILLMAPDRSFAREKTKQKLAQLASGNVSPVPTGSGSLSEVVAALHARGFNRILCEGGPSIYADVVAAGLADVLHVTLDPSISSADGPFGLPFPDYPRFEHRFVLEDATFTRDSMLFCRYRALR
ncbi:dihydrofolate reductase family protein [Corynebacterium sp. Q4381]|uniref:dihydrofolate reductase family protein n=1 Tax=Corynebacterium sp. Marseille-Q4381 TaxID=3121597 RepID=UPI002FE59075